VSRIARCQHTFATPALVDVSQAPGAAHVSRSRAYGRRLAGDRDRGNIPCVTVIGPGATYESIGGGPMFWYVRAALTA
jgi:hypothetical protein